MANIPYRLDYPPITHDPPSRTEIAAFYTVLDRWVQQVALMLDYGVLTRTLATNVSVPTGATSVTVTFAQAEPDTEYLVFVEPSWNTTWFISAKTRVGFTVDFSGGPPAPTGATFSWMRFR